MKLFPILKSFHPAQLSDQLVAAGLRMDRGTVRASRAADNAFAASGEVVVEDDAEEALVLAVIAAHVPKKSRLEELRDKRRAALPLTPTEQQEAIDLLLGL